MVDDSWFVHVILVAEMNKPTEIQPRRHWYQLRWWQCLLLIVLACVGWFYVKEQEGKAAWQATLAAWDAEGRWRWHQVVEDRPAVADEENLALIIGELAKRVEGARLYLDSDDKDLASLRSSPHGLLREHAALVLQRREKDAAAFNATLPKLYQSSKRSRMFIDSSKDPISTPMHLIDDSRAVQNRLNDLFLLDVNRGNIAAALQKLQAMNQLSHANSHEPGLVFSLMVRTFLKQQTDGIQRLLAQSEINAAQLQQLHNLLAPFDSNRVWKHALFTEAGGTNAMIEMIKAKKISANRLGGGQTPDHWWEYPKFWWDDFYYTQQIRSYQQAAEAMKVLLDVYKSSDEPLLKQYAKLQQLTDVIRAERKQMKVSLKQFFMPSFEKFCSMEMQKIASVRCALAAIAAEKFRLQHQRWPTSISELGLSAAMTDPFDEKPLRMKTVNDGLIIYSIGPDKKDDEGLVLSNIDVSTADIGFKLWNVPQRRQAATPVPKVKW